jgi:hypothetical protein
MAYAGVDLHKSFCQAIICTHEGKVLKEGRMPTEKEDIEVFFSGLERLGITLEASTNYDNITTISWRAWGIVSWWRIR